MIADDIKSFRVWAWAQGPVVGAAIDRAILQGSGFAGYDDGLGAALDNTYNDFPPGTTSNDSADSILSSITSTISTLANAGTLSLKSYFDAQTAVAQMQAASRAGMSVDQYNAIHNPAAGANAITSAVSGAGSNLIWIGLAGLAAVVLLSRR